MNNGNNGSVILILRFSLKGIVKSLDVFIFVWQIAQLASIPFY